MIKFLATPLWYFYRSVKAFFEILIRGVLCIETHEISLLYFLWYIHSGGGITRLVSVTNGAQVSGL